MDDGRLTCERFPEQVRRELASGGRVDGQRELEAANRRLGYASALVKGEYHMRSASRLAVSRRGRVAGVSGIVHSFNLRSTALTSFLCR